jgi:hypothetical protein
LNICFKSEPIVSLSYVPFIIKIISTPLFFAEIKALVIGFFKIIWFLSGKVISYIVLFFQNSWLAPIVEIFALSWILSKLEKIPFIGIYLRKFFDYLSLGFDKFFSVFIRFYDKYIYAKFSRKVKEKMIKLANWFDKSLEETKYKNEVFLFKKFIEIYLKKDRVHEYFNSIKGENFSDKKDLFSFINKKTNDSIDIVAFFDCSPVVNDQIKDVLILEGMASESNKGSSSKVIKKDSFWVLNLTDEEIIIDSKKGYFFIRSIKPGKIKLIHSTNQDFEDIYIHFNGENLSPIPVFES